MHAGGTTYSMALMPPCFWSVHLAPYGIFASRDLTIFSVRGESYPYLARSLPYTSDKTQTHKLKSLGSWHPCRSRALMYAQTGGWVPVTSRKTPLSSSALLRKKSVGQRSTLRKKKRTKDEGVHNYDNVGKIDAMPCPCERKKKKQVLSCLGVIRVSTLTLVIKDHSHRILR